MAKPKYSTPLGKKMYILAQKTDEYAKNVVIDMDTYKYAMEKLQELEALIMRFEEYLEEEIAPLTSKKGIKKILANMESDNG